MYALIYYKQNCLKNLNNNIYIFINLYMSLKIVLVLSTLYFSDEIV